MEAEFDGLVVVGTFSVITGAPEGHNVVEEWQVDPNGIIESAKSRLVCKWYN